MGIYIIFVGSIQLPTEINIFDVIIIYLFFQ